MKKLLIFCALLAGIAVMTSCQKEQGVVSLKAVIGQDTKAYFGGDLLNLPYWDDDDEVFVKGLTFSRSFGLTDPEGTFATITGVPASSVYCAIYPAIIVEEGSMGTPDANGTTASIYFNPKQIYKWENNHQRVDMPMGAVSTNETLIFKNLCSILRLNVTNALANTEFQNVDFDVMRLTVQAFGGYVAGFADVTLYADDGDDPVIEMNNPHHILQDNVLSVYNPNSQGQHQSMGTIYLSSDDGPTSKSFDIVVPPFSANDLVIEVELYNNDNHKALGYYEYRVNHSVSVGRNKIIPIDLEIDRYTIFDYAYLESGPEFNSDLGRILNNNIRWIKFNHNPGTLNAAGIYPDNQWDVETPSNWVELQASNSPHKIYGYVTTSDPTVLEINSFGSSLYCHSNCSTMFQGFDHFTNLQWTENVLFVTEDVTDMSYMFAGCSSMTTLPNINSFNTTNVTNMAHMFEGCSAMGSLDLSAFHTHHVTDNGMVAMFKNCTHLQTLILSNFTAERITSLEDMFNGCAALTTLYLPIFNTAQVTNMKNMFNGCLAMTNLYLNNFNMSNVSNENKLNMFKNMANSRTAENHCTVYCPLTVEQAILAQDNNGNYYSGLDDQNSTGNYYYYRYWDANGAEVWGRRIVFSRP